MFTMMFGGKEFFHLTGDLKFATMAAEGFDEKDYENVDESQSLSENNEAKEKELTEKQKKLEEIQNKRIDELLKVLQNRLKVYVQGEEESFISAAQFECEQLKQNNFGSQMLEAIGFGYYN
mmetsp:Transcript_25000/g.55235  ORF Transcript_25000/g.55235 Transcript_25000/m.55235 type:complete len:121 (+) Transcript_25000:290-652(+)